MTPDRQRFLENARRIIAAQGDHVPPASPRDRETADRAEKGQLFPAADGTYAQIDLDHTDWTCRNTYNPDVLQMYVLRFHVLVPLASLFRETRDERYARIARRYIEAFIRDHPTCDNWEPKPGDGHTQFDLRIGADENAGWLGTLHVFLESTTFDDEFFNTIVQSARAHLRYLAGNVHPDRNIRLMNGDVLMLNAVRLDFVPEARAWRDLGVRVLNDAIARQILPDGAHKEAVPGYHGGSMHILTAVWRLAQAMPELGLHIPSARIAAMHDYALATSRPDGATLSMHDTGHSPNRIAPARYAGGNRDKFRKLADLPDTLPPTTQHFPDAGQIYLRDSWTPDATYLSFDATTRRSFHWHASRNAITLFANRRALLTDTGYPFKTPEFPHYGSRTAHHSTLNLNGWDQTHAHAQLRARSADGYDLVEGTYDGGYFPHEKFSYGEGIFGEHYRAMLWLRGRCVVVLDQIYTTSDEGKKPTVEAVWQLSEGGATLDPANQRAFTTHDDGNLLMLFPLVPEGIQYSIHNGVLNTGEPMRGWLPAEWGRRCIPAPMVRLSAEKYDPWTAHFATVLVPFADKNPPQVTASAVAPDMGFGGRGAGKLELRWPDGSSDLIVWIRKLENAIGPQHGIDTDASLVHLQFGADGKFVNGLTVDGRYLYCEKMGAGEQIGRVKRV